MSVLRRPQFSVRTLLWVTLVVAAFLAGRKFGAWREFDRLDPFADEPVER
jgi:hypothetical protein